MNSLPYAARRLAEIQSGRLSPVEHCGGELSPAEARFIPEANAGAMERAARESSVTIYHLALRRAEDAREQLLDELAGHDPRTVESCAAVAKAVDRHSRAQSWLREAAQGVVDAHDYQDNGRAAGIVWETPLAGEVRRG